ncbi:hypothetical protein ASU31_10510 [Pedobacter ginsenosidimutans]|uniref:Uncharacterized protein n=1 Tax=Pedobacter ginsenosidimutans TaxID=687842 RepID=A0A0T5VPW9_9SPHI|nr:hypothetical protein ASU31_10510 [Pedobacter ginsenosidimutans]
MPFPRILYLRGLNIPVGRASLCLLWSSKLFRARWFLAVPQAKAVKSFPLGSFRLPPKRDHLEKSAEK